MKKFLTHFLKLSLCTALIFSAFSCQTEQLDPNDSLTTAKSKANKQGGPQNDNTSPYSHDPCDVANNEQVQLIAGKNTVVGYATVTSDGDNYTITYNITDAGYCLTSTHVSVVGDAGDFPMNNGNPPPGQFEYKVPTSMDCSGATYTIPVSKGTFFAIHGVVNCVSTGSLEDLETTLPDTVNFCITTGREIDNAEAYFYMEIAEGSLAGSYQAWCADESKSINATNGPVCYNDNTFNVYTLNDDLSGIVSQPDNLDNALYLINHSQELLSQGYLYGNIQWALWKLLNDQECNSCNENLKLPSGEDATIKGIELVNWALENGDGYVPGCGEDTLVILDDGIHQPLLIQVPIPCTPGDCEETIWAAGCNFPGNNWAMYFHFEG